MSRHHGKYGRLYMSTTLGGTPVSVASLDAFTLDMKSERVEVTSFGDTNRQYVQGFGDISGTFAGNWDDAVSTPWTGRKSATGVFLYLYPDITNSATKYAYGPAWVDMSISTSATGKVSVNGTFQAAGNWGDTFSA